MYILSVHFPPYQGTWGPCVVCKRAGKDAERMSLIRAKRKDENNYSISNMCLPFGQVGIEV